ncbi:MAG: DMT family transporter [Actinomycetota bacterium]|nr:DMT family transporter [Actinomycetota bacterium]
MTVPVTTAEGAATKRGHLALVIAALIWAGSFIVTDAALDRSGPFTILALRFIIALVFLAPLALRRGWRPRESLQGRFVLFGLTGIVLHLSLETSGLLFTSPAQASLVVAAIPAVTAGLAAVFLGERPRPANLLGIVLSVAGVALVTYAPSPNAGPTAALGNLLVFGGVIAWGIFTIQGRKMSSERPPIVSTCAAVAASLLFLAPLAAAEIALGEPPQFDLAGVGAIAYLGLLASGTAFALWNGSLRYVTASTAAGYINLVPVLGVALAVLAGDSVGAAQVLGGTVVGLGVWLTSRKTNPRAA